MSIRRTFAIGLGSNMGDRRRFLSRALALLDTTPGIRVLATSCLYESAGWGRPGLEPFLNAALACESDRHDPHDLLRLLLDTERTLGRVRTVRWGPRTIDLDLLACNGERAHSDDLTLPHPGISQRPFVYLLLKELLHEQPRWEELIAPTPEARAIEHETRRIEPAGSPWGRRALQNTCARLETKSEEQTARLGIELSAFLGAGDVVALEAPMGSGKSVVARGIARGLGITGPVPSPTFTLCRSYQASAGTLEHWDFYRLESVDDLESTGYFTPESAASIRLIEWAERFPEAVGTHPVRIRLEPVDADRRRVEIILPAGGYIAGALAQAVEEETR